MGTAVGQVILAGHNEPEPSEVANQLRSARVEERCALGSARESQALLDQRRADAAALRGRFDGENVERPSQPEGS
jgi:hypothetical protein